MEELRLPWSEAAPGKVKPSWQQPKEQKDPSALGDARDAEVAGRGGDGWTAARKCLIFCGVFIILLHYLNYQRGKSGPWLEKGKAGRKAGKAWGDE